MAEPISVLARAALADAARVVECLDATAFESFAQAIASAKTIALHGLGREGLQMKGLAMRLFHLGLDAHVVGEMTTPPVGAGDLLICSAGPGDFASIAALARIAKDAGAKTAIVTAQPASNLAKSADHVLHIPAQTMADDQGTKTSVLPMAHCSSSRRCWCSSCWCYACARSRARLWPPCGRGTPTWNEPVSGARAPQPRTLQALD